MKYILKAFVIFSISNLSLLSDLYAQTFTEIDAVLARIKQSNRGGLR